MHFQLCSSEEKRLEQAMKAIRIYSRIPIRFMDTELEESLTIAYALGIYAYDAYLIRCAVKYNSPLISLDQKLVNSAKRMGVKVMEVTQ